MHWDPTSQSNRAPSTRSVSQATSSRACAIEDRLRQGEMQWRNRVSQEHHRREEAMSRAHYIEEMHRTRAANQLQAEEVESAAVQRRQAQEIERRVMQRRATSAALSRKIDNMRRAEQAAAERKREEIEDKLLSSNVRHVQAVEGRRNSLAQQRSFRESVQEANHTRIQRLSAALAAKVAAETQSAPRQRSGSQSTTRSSVRHADHVHSTVERGAQVSEYRALQRLRKINEDEQRSQAALAKKQEEVEQRRLQKAARELEARTRVAQCERQRALTARRYESKFQEALDVGNRVAAFNAVCRVNF